MNFYRKEFEIRTLRLGFLLNFDIEIFLIKYLPLYRWPAFIKKN